MNTAIEHRNLDPLPIVCDIATAVEPPSMVKISPWGDVRSSSGNFVMDRQAAAEIIAAFTAGKVDLPIDAEHATLGGETYSTPTGDAPARGWIKSLIAVEGQGLFADVQWTALGAGFVRNKEYRYLSPVVMVRKSDRRAVALHSVALTNKPAITGMTPIVNSRTMIGAGARRQVIANAAREWKDGGRSVQGACGLDGFINMRLSDARLPQLGDGERGRQPADFLNDRRTVIVNAVREWESLQGQKGMFASKEAWVCGSLHDAGMSPLTQDERSGLELVVCGALAETEAGKQKLAVIMGDTPRATAIRKLAKEWKSNPHVIDRGPPGLQRYVAYNLDVELGDANTPELTQQEKAALNELIREEFASL